MNSVFVNASEGICGFHVVYMDWRTNLPTVVCRKLPRYVPYKCTYVPYNGTFGASDQGQMLDV